MRWQPKTIFSAVFTVIFLILAAAILPSAAFPAISQEALVTLAALAGLMGLTVGLILIFQGKAFKQ